MHTKKYIIRINTLYENILPAVKYPTGSVQTVDNALPCKKNPPIP
jgi:hypothetical protein